MTGRSLRKKLSSFRIIIAGFLAVILLGTLLLMLPVSCRSRSWTSFDTALFTSTSAVCVTGLVVRDTASYWSAFGQAVILILIQIGGLGIVSVTAFIAMVSGRKISLMQRSMLQESISAHHVGGIVRMTWFIFRAAFLLEGIGAVAMLPVFCRRMGAAGIWPAVFHSVSAFCNAGFDVMGTATGEFSSLSSFSGTVGIVVPVCLLIVIGGIGFLTWDDIAVHRFHLKKYRMQSKVILATTLVLLLLPALLLFFRDFSSLPLKERICLSVFHAVTPRTAGFSMTDLAEMTSGGRGMTIVLMLIGGSPGSTAGGMKTTTLAVLAATSLAVFRRRKNPRMFGRRIEENTVRNAVALLTTYLFLAFAAAFIISAADGLPISTCLFETASAIGTVGLSLGITPALSLLSRLVLIVLMFFGRVGGLTVMFAALSHFGGDAAQYPVEKINVG